MEKNNKIKEKLADIFYYPLYRLISPICRSIKWKWQDLTRGYSDPSWWNADYYIAKYALPRVKHLAERCYSFPPNITMKEWEKILKKIVYALDATVNEWNYDKQFRANATKMKKHWDKVQEGYELFGKYFGNLWD